VGLKEFLLKSGTIMDFDFFDCIAALASDSATCCYRRSSVLVCLLVTFMNPAKTAELNEIPVGWPKEPSCVYSLPNFNLFIQSKSTVIVIYLFFRYLTPRINTY